MQIAWIMSRSAKKHSSGFYDDNDNNNMKKYPRQKNDESSSSSSSDSFHITNHSNSKYRLPTPPPAPMLPPYKRTISDEIVEINDSDDDNNNEEASPDRHRVQEESIDTDKREDSNSSDVIFVGDSTEEIEKLSWIISDCKLNLTLTVKPFTTFAFILVALDPADKVSAADFKILKLLGTGAYGR